jgi:uncharacterized protein
MRKVVSIRLDELTVSAARSKARQQNRTLSNYIEAAVQRDLHAPAGETAITKPPRPTVAQAIATIRAHRAELERMGTRHIWIFGSIARGDERADSDVDVLIEFDPALANDLFAYGHIQQSLEEWMGWPVDIADKQRLRGSVAGHAERDQILAF